MIRNIILIIGAVIITSLLYELNIIKTRLTKQTLVINDSLRVEVLISKDINHVQKYNNNMLFKDIDSLSKTSYIGNNDLFQKIYNVEKEILIKAKSIADIGIVMDNISVQSPNLRQFPVIFPIVPGQSKISSTFGKRVRPTTGASSNHKGIDYAAPHGTPVHSPADGIVMYSLKGVKGYGNTIRVKHSFGFETVYGHLSKMIVNKGDSVKMGKIIAYVGNTGISTGPHLHYEILKDGKHLNPIVFTEVLEKKLEEINKKKKSLTN